MEIFISYVILSALVGVFGSSRKIGFGISFLLSLLLSPLIGFIIAVCSTSNATLEYQRKMLMMQKQLVSANTPQKKMSDEEILARKIYEKQQETRAKNKNILYISIALFIIIGFFSFVFYQYYTAKQYNNNQIVSYAIEQYEKAKDKGNKIEIAVQAGMVAEACKQVDDEENYNKWKEIEKETYKDAGVTPP